MEKYKLERFTFVFWIFSLVFSLLIPILIILIFPELLTLNVEQFYLIGYSVVILILILFFGLILKIGIKKIQKNPLRLPIKRKSFKASLFSLGLIINLAGISGIGYISYYQIDVYAKTYRETGPYISSPKIGAPYFQEPDKNFTCELEGGDFGDSKFTSIFLKRGIQYIPLEFDKVNNRNLNVKIPKSTEDGLYSLIVQLDNRRNDKNLTELYSIRVWNSSNHLDNQIFRVAHITDTHVDPGNQDELLEYFQKQIDFISIMNPDLVLLTGDLTNNGKIHQFIALKDFLTQFGTHDIPIFTVMGNHDQYSKDYSTQYYWSRNFAPFHFYRDIPGENLRFINFNTGLKKSEFNLRQEWSFIQNSLVGMANDQESVLVCHIPPYRFCDWAESDMQEKELNDLCDLYDVEALIAGHSHNDRVVGRRNLDSKDAPGDCSNDYPKLYAPFNETVYIETQAKYNGPCIRWINFEHGKILNCTYDQNNDGILDQANSIFIRNNTLGNKALTMNKETNWSTIINNRLNMNLWNAKATVILPNITTIMNENLKITETKRIIEENGDITKIKNNYICSIQDSSLSEDGLKIDFIIDILENCSVEIEFTFEIVE